RAVAALPPRATSSARPVAAPAATGGKTRRLCRRGSVLRPAWSDEVEELPPHDRTQGNDKSDGRDNRRHLAIARQAIVVPPKQLGVRCCPQARAGGDIQPHIEPPE